MNLLLNILIRFTEKLPALRMANDHIPAEFPEHQRRDLARIGAFIFPMDILCPQGDPCVAHQRMSRLEGRKSGTKHAFHSLYLLQGRKHLCDQRHSLFCAEVHFPVSGYQRDPTR